MLTFEALREQERKEKSSNQIEKMPSDFVSQLQEYVQRKIKKSDGSSDDRREIDNIKHSIQRLLEIREHKILDAVMYGSRTGLKPDNLTEHEQKMFDVVLKEINSYRDSFMKEVEKGSPQKQVESKVIEKTVKAPKEVLKVDIKKYLVKRDVKKFISPDLTEKELKKGEILRESDLPKTLNDLLLKRGIIEETK
ncbi:hypothetical protein CL614_04475 [archaeon]|nr:hypothetical protein [archaeon]|tara:strand:- start:587 stop:1168 length:582 start_codon:yes stop_codon:yes gene_type:complete